MKRFTILVVMAIPFLGGAQSALAAQAAVKGRITRTVVADGDRWGGCLVSLDKPIASAGLNCPGAWVAFGCSGSFGSKDIAFRMFDSAQMAYALGHGVIVTVDDSRKLNGLCYANRIDVLP